MEEWLRVFIWWEPPHSITFEHDTCHPHIKLSNVQVVWFPPNTTCESHPVDQGVTNCTKLNYCQLLMWSLLANCCHWTCKVHTLPWCNHLISRGVKASVSTHTQYHVFRKHHYPLLIWIMKKQIKIPFINSRSHFRLHMKVLRQKITLTLVVRLKQRLLWRKSSSSLRATSKVRKRKIVRLRKSWQKKKLPWCASWSADWNNTVIAVKRQGTFRNFHKFKIMQYFLILLQSRYSDWESSFLVDNLHAEKFITVLEVHIVCNVHQMMLTFCTGWRKCTGYIAVKKLWSTVVPLWAGLTVPAWYKHELWNGSETLCLCDSITSGSITVDRRLVCILSNSWHLFLFLWIWSQLTRTDFGHNFSWIAIKTESAEMPDFWVDAGMSISRACGVHCALNVIVRIFDWTPRSVVRFS